MNKNPIQSNLPEFNASRMTSEKLYQHPEPAPQPYWLSNFSALLLLISIFIGLAAMFTYEADQEAAIKQKRLLRLLGVRNDFKFC